MLSKIPSVSRVFTKMLNMWFYVLRRHKLTVLLIATNCLLWFQILSYINGNVIGTLNSNRNLIRTELLDFDKNRDLESSIHSVSHIVKNFRDISHSSNVIDFTVPLWLSSPIMYFPMYQELNTLSHKLDIVDRHLYHSENLLSSVAGITSSVSGVSYSLHTENFDQEVHELRNEVNSLSSSIRELKSSLKNHSPASVDGILWAISPFSEMWSDYHEEAVTYLDVGESVAKAFSSGLSSVDIALKLESDFSTVERDQYPVDRLNNLLLSLSVTVDDLILIEDTLSQLDDERILKSGFQREKELFIDSNHALKLSISHLINIVTVFRDALSVNEEDTYIHFSDKALWATITENLSLKRSILLTELDGLAEAYAELYKHSGVVSEYGLLSIYSDSLGFIEEIISDLSYGYKLSMVVSEIMGGSEEKVYLLLAHSSDELRPTGGFVSGIWTMTVHDFKIAGLNYYDVIELDNGSHIEDYPDPPYLLREYMGAGKWFIRDVSWFPDFGHGADSAREMFHISTGIEIDGVIGINQWALVDIVQGLDGVKLEAGKGDLEPLDLITTLERGTDDSGREYADIILRSVLQNVGSLNSFRNLWEMSQVVKGTFRAKDVQLHLVDPKQRQLIKDMGLDGSVKSDIGDFIYVVDSNIGWSKSDRNIERSMSYLVDLSDIPKAHVQLKLTYKNHSGFSAAQCEPQWVDRGDKYSELKNACHWNLLRIYTPLDILVKSHTLLPLPKGSIRAARMGSIPLSDTFSLGTYDDSFTEMSGLIVTDVSDEDHFSVSYSIPKYSSVEKEGCHEYFLTIRKQPGVRYKKIIVTIVLPENVEIIDNEGIKKIDGSTLYLDVLFESNNSGGCTK